MEASYFEELELERLLNESVDVVRSRRENGFDRMIEVCDGRIVVYGAGKLGKKIIRGLFNIGKPPVAAVDKSASDEQKTFEGIPLLSPSEAVARYGLDSVFLVAVMSSGQDRTFANISASLKLLGCKHVIPVLPLLWQHPDLFLPHESIVLPEFVITFGGKIRAAYKLLSDDVSRTEFLARVKLALVGDPMCLPSPTKHLKYFPCELFTWSDDECFADCGAYDGDTLREILSYTGDINKPFYNYFAFEPDPASFEKLKIYVENLENNIKHRINIYNIAVGKDNGYFKFCADGTEAARFDNDGDVEVACIALDKFVEKDKISYIKFDIEGAEADAIAGAQGIIKKNAPIIAISAYHKMQDLWEIPLQIASIQSSYKLFLRRYINEFVDVVLYAVPRRRLV